MNVVGILVALGGVFLYNRAKVMEGRRDKSYLPLHTGISSSLIKPDFV